MKGDQIDCLDKGYVRLIDTMGDDLSCVNAARVSYARESDELTDGDKRLLGFLARHNHSSPWRHAFASFEIYAPLEICRQWLKYAVGSNHGEWTTGWNELSRRYVTKDPEFYVVDQDSWRKKPANSKQGSAEPLHRFEGGLLTDLLIDTYDLCLKRYNRALIAGVAPEMARLFLPGYAMYTCWRWSASVQSVAHFLDQRLKSDAQHEITEYAKAVRDLITPEFPATFAALLEDA